VLTFYGQEGRGVLQMRTSALLDAKNFGFFEFYGVSVRTRGVEPVRTFFGQGGGGQFSMILCGRLLWTAPNNKFAVKDWYIVAKY